MAPSASNGSATLLASELTARARESAAALEVLLQCASGTWAPAQHDGIRELAHQIFCCLDRALAALQSEGCIPSKKGRLPTGTVTQARPKRRARATGAEMPNRVEKRSTPDDGLPWRKYGQKDILNSNYPRTYFRCTYKYDNGCKATRQVQQSEDDPSIYVVTYFGEHTCGMDVAAGEEKSSPQLVINFGSGTTGSGSAWLSSSDDDVGSNSSRFAQVVCLPEEDDGGEQKANVCNVESSVAPPTEPSSSADDSCASPDLDSLLHYFEWESNGDSLFGMDFIDFDEATLLQ